MWHMVANKRNLCYKWFRSTEFQKGFGKRLEAKEVTAKRAQMTLVKYLHSIPLQSRLPTFTPNRYYRPKSSSKVEWMGVLYSCLHAFIHWSHRGAGLKKFIHLPHGSFGSSMQACLFNNGPPRLSISTRWQWIKGQQC